MSCLCFFLFSSSAKTEMEMYTDLFNKIASSCYQKCASRKHRDQDLSLGEMTCTGMLKQKGGETYCVCMCVCVCSCVFEIASSTFAWFCLFPLLLSSKSCFLTLFL